MKVLFDERGMFRCEGDERAAAQLLAALRARLAEGESLTVLPPGAGLFEAMWCRMRTRPDIFHSVRGIRRLGFVRHGRFSKPGVDPGRFRPLSPAAAAEFRARRHLPEKYLLLDGPDEPRRNLAVISAALNELDSTEILPIVVTGVRPGDQFRREIERRHLADSVIFLGASDPDERPALVAAAALYLEPGLVDGSHRDIAEAMASGTPVVASALPGTRRLFSGAARLVHPREPKEWSLALRSAVFSLDWHEGAVRRGLELAAGFTWARVADELLQFYRRVYRKRPLRLRSAALR